VTAGPAAGPELGPLAASWQDWLATMGHLGLEGPETEAAFHAGWRAGAAYLAGRIAAEIDLSPAGGPGRRPGPFSAGPGPQPPAPGSG